MQARIYAVRFGNFEPTLVKATTQAQALRHVAKANYTVAVASALEVAERMAAGTQVADATKDEPETAASQEQL